MTTHVDHSPPQQEFERLGRRDLGRHAFEERWPASVSHALENGGTANYLPDVVPKLAKLLERDREIVSAHLCTSRLEQVSKLSGEGGHFCGYHNLQMLWSAVASDQSQKLPLPQRLTIPQLQDLIEQAWSEGFNPHGKIVTGGIRETRKHIGSSEAEAFLLSRNVPCTGNAFQGKRAWEELLDSVENYYSSPSVNPVGDDKVKTTSRYPIFLQRPYHSITIIGLARTKSNDRILLTVDPAFQPPPNMQLPTAKLEASGLTLRWTLQRYRKSLRYLKRFNAFETLQID